MLMNDTPLTDAADLFFCEESLGHTKTCVDIEFARKLERAIREALLALASQPIKSQPERVRAILTEALKP